MKVLLIGNGGREHALAEAFKNSPKCTELLCFAGKNNPGIRNLSTKYEIGNILDFEHVQKFAQKEKPDFAFVGPDDPIGLGCADVLESIGIPTVAPKQMLARLESSKSFTRNLLRVHNLEHVCPKFAVVTNINEAKSFLKTFDGEFVVKMDGLCGGKGVMVQGDQFKTIDEGLKFAEDCIQGQGKVVLEEKLIGQEFSLMSFVDGKTVYDMPIIQDHKRAFDDDQGPNTGGMGSYSYPKNLPFLTENDREEAHKITVSTMKALQEECGEIYKGIMYGGFIATKTGVKVIEYNARFGDPEAMNALPLLQTDFVDICLRILNQTLFDIKVEFEEKATVCKYVVPEGYPENPKKGEKITVTPPPDGVKMYYSSIDEKNGEIFLSSSRAIAFVGIGKTVEEAEQLSEKAVLGVKGPVFHRKDIGTKKLIEKRIEMMKTLRG